MSISGNQPIFYSSITNTETINGASVDFSQLGLTNNRVLGYFNPNITTNITTSGLQEGANLYYTNARSRAALSGGANITYNSTTGSIAVNANPTFTSLTIASLNGILKATAGVLSTGATTDDLPEGKTNLYYTNARSRLAISGSTGIGYDNTSGLISNTGVTRLFGTANRVTVNANSGMITVTGPQDIATNSSPQFARLLNSSINTNNMLLGTQAGTGLTTGTDNIIIGATCATSLTTGTYNICMGDLAGQGSFPLESGLRSIYIGAGAYPSQPSPTREIVIGGIAGNGSNTCTIAALNGLYVSNLSNGLLKTTSGMITQAAASDYVASITSGSGIAITGGPGNFTISNSGVVSLVPGTSISIAESPSGTFTINNTGVTSLTGTSNRVTVSASTGAITLSGPQDIGINSYPQFASIRESSIGTQNVLINGFNFVSGAGAGGNTLIGSFAGYNVTTGGKNIAIGLGSLYGGASNLTSSDGQNIAIGTSCLGALQGNASYNVAVGPYVGANLTTGNRNILYGHNAGRSISTSNDNICIGNYAMGLGGTLLTSTNGANVTIGNFAGYKIEDTGNGNTCLGDNSGYNISYGMNNIAVGKNSLGSINTGSYNIAVGSSALTQVSSGNYNVHIGNNTQGSSTSVGSEMIFSAQSATTIGKGANTAFINAPAGLYSYNPAICYLYGTGLSNGRVQWATWDTGNVPTKGFYLTNYGNGANTVIVPNVYGHYEITINGAMLGNGSNLTLTFNNTNVRNYNVWYQSFSSNGIAYSLSATMIARPYTVVNLSGFEFQLTNMTLWGGLPLFVCIKFIGF